jgi:hypothetical protein
MQYEVTTQAELDAALAKAGPLDLIVCRGSGHFSVRGSATVRASGSATVEASDSATVRASGSATVRAWGSATVEAWGSATVRAWDSATVRASDSATVRASGSATVRASGSATVRAWGSATVEAWDSATVRASKYVAIHIVRAYGGNPQVTGGIQIEVPPIDSPEAFCDFYGVEVVDGVATLYKATDDDYSTSYARRCGISYRPGEQPVAPDWNDRPECGGGLHFSPRPRMARQINGDGTKHYLACPVRLDEMVVVEPGYGANKVKAPRICGPIVEVDADGDPLPVVKPKRARKPKVTA